jgi:hypothetical protein
MSFRIELTKYIEANRTRLEQAPFGLYAVVPPHVDYQQIASGVLFCLKQVGDTAGNEQVNPPRADSAEGRRPSTGPEKRSAPRAGQRLDGAVASRWRPPARSLRDRNRL